MKRIEFISGNNVYFVSPSSISYQLRLRRRFSEYDFGAFDSYNVRQINGERYCGLLVNDEAIEVGDKFQSCPHVKALKERFVDGKEWRDTGYSELHEVWYKRFFKGRENASFSDLYEDKLKGWDQVYLDIKKNGYKASENPLDNIQVCIDKDGGFLFIDGRHRLFFAQILGIEKVPVVANIISKTWASSQ